MDPNRARVSDAAIWLSEHPRGCQCKPCRFARSILYVAAALPCPGRRRRQPCGDCCGCDARGLLVVKQ